MAQTDDYSDNELDAFDTRNEQVLLDQAGEYMQGHGSSEDESEEEVLGLKHQGDEESEDESDDGGNSEENEGAGSENESENGSENERWGSKKNYYGGDDVSDDDGGNEMAEEALRQQKKHVQDLAMDDYVDEAMMHDWQKSAVQDGPDAHSGAVVEEKEVDFAGLDDDEKRKHLNGSFPEFVPLLNEYEALHGRLAGLQAAQTGGRVARAKFVALSAYLGAISSYFALFADRLRVQHAFSMKEDPVMEAILSTREVWRQASELREASAEFGEISEISETGETGETGEIAESDDEPALATDSEASEDEGSQDEQQPAVSIDYRARRAIRTPQAAARGDYTESATPDAVDREEKERRKKSLRFYTSKIDQAAHKHARHERFDGDADLPYRERLFERQQRLVEAARKKGLGQDKAQLGADLGADLDDASADEASAQQINAAAGEYYDSIRSGKAAAKSARRSAHEQAAKAARAGQLAALAETVDEHGKRALNFQILKNKGLTPHRRNDNRNARVKKRKRYDQAQKKLRSVRQVYGGDQGPYQGEKTGIKKGLSRSVRLQ